MTRAISCILVVLIATAALAGCGNKGALVLPDQPSAKKHKKADSTPAPAPKPADPAPQGSGSR
jgi:predicted small lipoprotein YifL